MLKESQASIRQAVRDIEREQRQLQQREAVRVTEIKAFAARGGQHMETVRVMAKDLVRMRSAIAKFYAISAELQSVSVNLATMASTAVMAEALRDAAKSMMRMNATQSLPAMQKILSTFVREQDMLEMKQDVMNDTMNDTLGTDEGAEDEVVSRVLDEIGIRVAMELPASAVGRGAVALIDDSSGVDPEIRKRLNELRK
jgi:charged multivesicular body protein 2A